jgi:hypothetical protein
MKGWSVTVDEFNVILRKASEEDRPLKGILGHEVHPVGVNLRNEREVHRLL